METVALAVLALVAINAITMTVFFLILKSRFSRGRILGELRAEVDRLVMDLGREADRDVAVLESRIQNLRALMDEADRRILVARKETSRRREESDILRTIALASGGAAAEPDRTRIDARGEGRVETSQWVEPGESTAEGRDVAAKSTPHTGGKPAAAKVDAVKPAAVRPVAEKSDRVADEPVRIYTRPTITRGERQIEPFVPVQERVLDMARRGFTAELISGTLSMPLGEVELILDMNRSSP